MSLGGDFFVGVTGIGVLLLILLISICSNSESLIVVDVRKEIEFGDGHVKDAMNIPLGSMIDPASMANFEDSDNLYVHCAGGYRSVIAASLLKRQGIHNLRNVLGGWSKIKDEPKIEKEKEAAILN